MHIEPDTEKALLKKILDARIEMILRGGDRDEKHSPPISVTTTIYIIVVFIFRDVKMVF